MQHIPLQTIIFMQQISLQNYQHYVTTPVQNYPNYETNFTNHKQVTNIKTLLIGEEKVFAVEYLSRREKNKTKHILTILQ